MLVKKTFMWKPYLLSIVYSTYGKYLMTAVLLKIGGASHSINNQYYVVID